METTAATRHRPHRAPVYALLGANAVSLVGNVIAALAIPWFVLETTGSASRTGLVGFFTVLPTVLAACFGGGLVDRLGARRMSIVSDLLSGGTVALIPLLHLTVGLPFWALLVLVCCGALFDAPGTTARAALFPDIVSTSGMPLERANAAYQGIQRLSQLLGPISAGLLIAGLGPSNVLWLDAASFAVSAGLVAVVVPAPASDDPAHGQGRYLDDMREGLRFLWRDRLLRTLAVTVAITNLLDTAVSGVLMPVYALDTFGSARALGLLYGGFGAGAVASTILFGAVGHKLPRRAAYVGGFVGAYLPVWILVFTSSLPIAVGARVLAGLAVGPLNPILMTIFQERVPPAMRGRVLGTVTSVVLAGAPLGVLVAGVLVEAVGLRPILFAVAACYLVATGSLAVTPTLRRMDDTKRRNVAGGPTA